jgi:hypothetical protein
MGALVLVACVSAVVSGIVMLTTTDLLITCCTVLCRRAAIASRAEAQRQLAAEQQRSSALESARRRSAECRHTLLQQQSQAERELAATLQGFAGDVSDIDSVYESDCDAAAVQDDIESNHSYYEEEAQQLHTKSSIYNPDVGAGFSAR